MNRNDTGSGSVQLDLKTLRSILQLDQSGSLKEELRDVVFLSIDCEAYEFAQHKVTETPHGPNAVEWFSQIKSEHFRIREYGHLVNKKYVKGCPELFSFGTSTWIAKADASSVIRSIFEHPAEVGKVGASTESASRNIVLVGHGLRNEVPYLRNLDFDLIQAPNIVCRFDTERLGSNKGGIGLGRLCKIVGLDSESLHNAGNDAAYTLRAMLLAAILDSSTEGGYKALLAQAPAPEVTDRVQRKKEARPPRPFRKRPKPGVPAPSEQNQQSKSRPE